MAQFQNSAAKYAIVLGNDELTVLGSVRFFKVVDLGVFHFSLILELFATSYGPCVGPFAAVKYR